MRVYLFKAKYSDVYHRSIMFTIDGREFHYIALDFAVGARDKSLITDGMILGFIQLTRRT